MTPTLETAVHLAHGDAAADKLAALGATDVLVRRDLLTVGPCHADPERHRALRRQWWGAPPPEAPSGLPGVDGDEELGAALAARAGRPLVIWASRGWSDLTFLWSAVDALSRLGAPRPWLVRPAADDGTSSVGGIAPARLRDAFGAVEPLREDVARSCVNFWHAYADASPLPFDELRRRGAAVVPELGRILAGHTAWFPRREGDVVRLADADRAIFRWAEDGDADEVRTVMHWIGDRSLFARVAEWQARGALAGEARAPTLTEAGRRLGDAGAPTVAALPPWWVGGCRVNDPASPWVLVGERIVADPGGAGSDAT